MPAEPTIKAKVKFDVDEGELAGAIARAVAAGTSGGGSSKGGGGAGIGTIAAGVATGNVVVSALSELVARSSALNELVGTIMDMLDIILMPVIVIFQLLLMPVLVWIINGLKPAIEKQVEAIQAIHDFIFGKDKEDDTGKSLTEIAQENVANAPMREEDLWAQENLKKNEQAQSAILTTWEDANSGIEEQQGLLQVLWDELGKRSAEARKQIEEDAKENKKNWEKFQDFVGEDIPVWLKTTWEEDVQPFFTETVPEWIGSVGLAIGGLFGEKGLIYTWIDSIGSYLQTLIDKIMTFLGMKTESEDVTERATSGLKANPQLGQLGNGIVDFGAQNAMSATINLNAPVDQDKLVEDMTNWLMFKGLVVNGP